MTLNLQDSVVLLTGSEEGEFGTGFSIYQDEHATYIVTCTHVVNDVGGAETIKVNGTSATVIVSDSENGFDLAVSRVEKALNIPLLKLSTSGDTDHFFSTAGFYLEGKKTLCQVLTGTLDKQVGLNSKEQESRSTAWHLNINGSYFLQPGYSGAPVVNRSGDVLGIISQRRGGGEKGLAISVEALKMIWLDMPSSLLSQTEALKITPTFRTQPFMNLTEELNAFEKIAAHQDTQTRLILVSGEGGMGNTDSLG